MTRPTSIWLSGAAAEPARAAAIELLESLGVRAASVLPSDDAAAVDRLARAGLVVVGTGKPPAGADPEAAVIDAPDAATAARQVLKAYDHGLEVASRPIFVVGLGRSGTTWMLDLLAAHPRVKGLFETLVFAPETLGHLHRRVDYEAYAAGDDRRRYGIGQLTDRAAVGAAVRANAVQWLASVVGPEHDWLVEKTPSQAGSLEAIAAVLPEARVVHVVRDPRDVLVSRAARMRAGSTGPPRSPDAMVRNPLALRTAREWRWTVEHVDRARRLLPVHEVRYEALHADAETELARVLTFCGIPAPAELVRSMVAANAFGSLPRTGEGQFRRGGRVGDWRRQLPRWERALVHAAAGRAMAEHGYRPGPGPAYRATRLAVRARRALRA